MIKLTLKSMLERKLVVALCLLSIALSTLLYLGVSRLKDAARDGFTGTISGADLIVGAKGGPLNLLLYSVFHMGSPTNNIRYESFEKWSDNPRVSFTIPISLGDSYRGFRVVGTNENFIKYYRYQGDHQVELASGEFANGIWGVALGSEVARALDHKMNEQLVLSHGISEASVMSHDHTPFRVVGILKPTGTPIDRSVFITLQGMEAMHIGWESGIPDEDKLANPETLKYEEIKIHQITSFIMGLRSKIAILHMRRAIDEDRFEPLMAIIPGVALSELWDLMANIEIILKIISVCVLVVGVIGIVISLTTSLQSRRVEMAILRSVGGAPRHIVTLLLSEAFILALLGFVIGEALLLSGLTIAIPLMESKFGLALSLKILDTQDLIYLGLTLIMAIILSLIPATMAYRISLKDGLSGAN